jgi:lysophospholipase
MVNLNLTRYPTFFGCNATSEQGSATPLVLYIPNAPWTQYTNYSYTQPSFTDKQFDMVMDNSFNVATFGNGTVDDKWPACLACAVIKKSLIREATLLEWHRT